MICIFSFYLDPAKFNNVSKSQTVREGSDLQLVCGAYGLPVPNITWSRVFKNGRWESKALHIDPTWNIVNINRADGGIYRCTAHNGVGNPASHILKVDVLCKSANNYIFFMSIVFINAGNILYKRMVWESPV